jgi:2-methylisocitrate lyase-like PEP mutase family enzyme
MDHKELRKRALAFMRLHNSPKILVLPNAWDVASARVFEDAGFPAIGTSSAGIAASLGYADHEQVGRERMMDAVNRIVNAVTVPVTADLEAGYGDTPEDVAETARQAIASGAVGMNLEDSPRQRDGKLVDIEAQTAKIRAIRQVAYEAGIHLFIVNARTDVYLSQIGNLEDRFNHAVLRLNAYREAGADCLFLPGIREKATIAALVAEAKGPVSILASAGAPTISELERLGVTRVSFGSGMMRAAMRFIRAMADEMLATGGYTDRLFTS